ncbi:lysophospholipid acyltransferase family protein [bacterium]|nr:lysophospholipid acyltransferase family protein [bacterium]
MAEKLTYKRKNLPRKRMPSENFPVPFWYRAMAWIGTWILSLIMRAIYATCRYEHHGTEAEIRMKQKYHRAVYAAWHRDLLQLMYVGRRRRNGLYNPACIASRSKDGEWAAGLIRRLGYCAPRGSSTRFGREALAEIVDLSREGYDCALACDAPKGPAQRCKMGTVILAARSGVPIVPSAAAVWPCWRPKTWDGTVIPKPFARFVCAMDPDHVIVPDGADEAAIERCRKRLEDKMNVLSYQTDAYLMRPGRYATPFDVPVPDDYLGDAWDPQRHSLARGEYDHQE